MKLAVFATLLATASAFSIKADLPKVAAGAAVAFTVASAPVLAADVEAGETVFNANCAACHAGGQNVIMPEKTLEKEALESYLAGGRNEKAVMTQVTNGKNAMPAFGGRNEKAVINQVTNGKN